MSLNFHQPGDCRLSHAAVSITFKEYKGGNKNNESFSSSLHITNRFGPRELFGQERKIAVKKNINFTPNFTVLSNGGGGVGFDSAKDVEYVKRWKFIGQLIPADHPNKKGYKTGVYRTLEWDLTESDFETQATHSDVFHTAFAFEHTGDEFYMEVEIEGKLKSPKDRIRRYLNFSSRGKGSKGPTLLVGPPPKNGSSPKLDALADDLPRAMEIENLLAVPTEMPHAMPALARLGGIAENIPVPSMSGAILEPIEGLQAHNDFPTSVRGIPMPSLGDPTFPSIENLTKALSVFVDRRQPVTQRPVTKPENPTLKSVEEVVELESGMKTDSSSDTKTDNEQDPEPNHETMAIMKERQVEEARQLLLSESPYTLFVMLLLRVVGIFSGVTKLSGKPPSDDAKQNLNSQATT
ncbi:hypothetical protein BOTCAL_0622g00010 [Botryotinia calthae]|uniref:Uncharacterized protein n=1 Tax=Botryotinia calthae TaxID=38488 RepID=A0A4Y8CIE6_9HELO|nr:hypothetical protein BOTCAL_0622g00010 [Botryotinia calthae]